MIKHIVRASLGVAFAAIFVALAFAQSYPGQFPANTVYAGPPVSGSAIPAPRALVGADLPNPSASTLGGVKSLTCATHQWLNSISVAGQPVCSQPSMADLGLTNTRAGDIAYWNGSTWVILAGNNSGSQVLSENASGVPSWITATGSGTLTSLVCGTGLSGGTITTTGTCAVSLTNATNSLGADVSLNNTANYFDGPSTAQGTSGTWFASGTVTLQNTSTNNAAISCKLWDGTTVIASSNTLVGQIAGTNVTMALSGILATPAANIRISCRDSGSTASLIKFNGSGNSKDSTLTVVRIQ